MKHSFCNYIPYTSPTTFPPALVRQWCGSPFIDIMLIHLRIGNASGYSQMLVSLVAADVLVLMHQDNSNGKVDDTWCTRSATFEWICLLQKWKHLSQILLQVEMIISFKRLPIMSCELCIKATYNICTICFRRRPYRHLEIHRPCKLGYCWVIVNYWIMYGGHHINSVDISFAVVGTTNKIQGYGARVVFSRTLI